MHLLPSRMTAQLLADAYLPQESVSFELMECLMNCALCVAYEARFATWLDGLETQAW